MSVAERITSWRPTAAPPFPWVLKEEGAERSGVKPRITLVSTTSVSVVAESDVFLPCKATGNPKPSITWTKVSTGKQNKKTKQEDREGINDCGKMKRSNGKLMQSVCAF